MARRDARRARKRARRRSSEQRSDLLSDTRANCIARQRGSSATSETLAHPQLTLCFAEVVY